MNVLKIALGVVVLAAIAAVDAASAKAQCNGAYFGQAFGLMNAYGSSGTMYGLGRVPVPPYYSLHPPVYYGYRVARPYGYSPYAAPAGVLPSEFVQAPKLIDNPFYVDAPRPTTSPAIDAPAEDAGDDPAAETTSIPTVTARPVPTAPAIIVNPYYVAPADAARIGAAL